MVLLQKKMREQDWDRGRGRVPQRGVRTYTLGLNCNTTSSKQEQPKPKLIPLFLDISFPNILRLKSTKSTFLRN